MISELHTNTLRVPTPPALNVFSDKNEIKYIGMYVVWLSPSGCGGFTGTSQGPVVRN